MPRNAIVICLFAVIVLCIGCSEQANIKLSNTSQPALASYNCPAPDCFFERYPENWEHERYQRQLMYKYQQQQLAQK